jgi:hypothetical protein
MSPTSIATFLTNRRPFKFLRFHMIGDKLPTRMVTGMVLFRIRTDLSGTSGYGGLWLDTNKRPQVEIYRSTTPGGTRSFIALPHPEKLVSFSDDNRPYGSGPPQCSIDVDNRQNFTGCCDNPAAPAANALILYPGRPIGEQLAVSATFTWQDPCSRYVVLNPPGDINPKPGAPVWSSNTTYNIGDIVVTSADSTLGFVCVQAGQSGGTEPTWPNVRWPGDPSQEVTDNTAKWKMAVGSLLFRLRDHNIPCDSGDPSYAFEDAGMLLHPYPAGYRRDGFYGPWANVSPLPGTTGTLLGYRPVKSVTDDTHGQYSFTVEPNLLNCTFNVSPASINIASNGGTRSVTITSLETRCVWSAQSNDAFITLTTPNSGVGTNDVSFDVSANPGTARNGTLTIAGTTVTVSQSASIPAPTGLVATRQSTTSATITWQPSSGATTYELFRATTTATYASISANAVSPYTDATLSPGVTYLYEVRGVSGIEMSSFSNVDLTTTVLFTDDPLIAGISTALATHVMEVREAVAAMRTAAGLGPPTYTDHPIVPETTEIKAMHISELRAQLVDALVALGLGSPPFTDPTLTPGETTLKASHIQELRDTTR